MNLDIYEQRVMEYGLVPVTTHPEWRRYLCVKRAACGCYLKVHYAPKPLSKIEAKCPRCGDTTAHAPIRSRDAYADITYENYIKQVLCDFPHLAVERQVNPSPAYALDTVIARLEATQMPKPTRTVLDVFMDELAANVQYLLQQQQQRGSKY